MFAGRADRLIEDLLDDVGDPRRTVVEVGSYACTCGVAAQRRRSGDWNRLGTPMRISPAINLENHDSLNCAL
jgi:hypothetical protein